MRVLGAAVLMMESMVMGFALLLAGKHHSSAVLISGGGIAILFIVAGGLLKVKIGWVLGSVLQIAAISYGVFVTPMYFLGTLFGGLWICAIVVGRKGEAARAAFKSGAGSQ